MPTFPTGQGNQAVPQDLYDYYLGLYSPQTGYEKYLGGRGLGGQDPLGSFARSQYQQNYQKYLLAQASDPTLSFTNFLGSTSPSQPGVAARQAGNQYLNVGDPTAGFYGYLSGAGYGDNSGQSQYARSQFGRTYSDYKAQAGLHGSTEGFYDYLNRTAPQFSQEYNALSPQQRGINSAVSMPKVRWIL